jgi:hypothetical protein
LSPFSVRASDFALCSGFPAVERAVAPALAGSREFPPRAKTSARKTPRQAHRSLDTWGAGRLHLLGDDLDRAEEPHPRRETEVDSGRLPRRFRRPSPG